jgi:predicted alpha/beta hydrolase family esterase
MFLILHGWRGSDAPHWQAWLADQLAQAGQQVSFPHLPNRDVPGRAEWLAALDIEMRNGLATGEPVTVICHSLSVPLWLHYIRQDPAVRVSRVLMVAPPGWAALREYGDAIGDFAPVPLDAGAVAQAAATTRLVCSDGDPYCVEGAHRLYGEPLDIAVDKLPRKAGHVNAEAGFGPWPAALDWCLGRRSCLAGTD